MLFTRIKGLVAGLYREVVMPRKRDDLMFWILASFIVTFAIARLVVHILPGLFLAVGGTHIHHFTYGFVLLAISGFIGVTRILPRKRWLAVLYGIGLALAADETGMWLHLNDDYQNRQSFDALVLILALLINAVYFRRFWQSIAKLALLRRK